VPRQRAFPAKHPSPQEIQDYLNGLNRTEQSGLLTSDSVRLQALAIDNYRKWFKHYHIPIYQEPRTLIWQLGPAPDAEASIPDEIDE
jgi:hypothetical protein